MKKYSNYQMCVKYISIFLILIFNIQIFSQWTEQTITPIPPKLNCVSTNNINESSNFIEGWIGGDNGTILYTSNGGTNWFYRNNSVTGTNNISIIQSIYGYPSYTSSGKALCSANSSTTTFIYRTSNQGINWVVVYQQLNGRIRSISMFDSLTGFALGDPVSGRWTILKTTNGGISFDSSGLYLPQNSSEISNYNSMYYGESAYSTNTYLIFGTNNNRIYRSTSNGTSWNFITFPFQNIYSVCLARFIDFGPQVRCNWWGYAVGNGSDSTGTYGQTWGAITLPGSGDIHTLYCESGYICYAKGSQIYSSTNFSSSFGLQYTSPNGGNYTQISLDTYVFEGGSRGGWGVKDNGTVSKYFVEWSGIKKIGYDIPTSFSLYQNYPNPFNPSTTIKFDIPASPNSSSKGGVMKVTLKIYDILGREVASLIPPLWGGQEGFSSGSYEVKWNAGNYASGLYFYKLSAISGAGEFTETKKLVLLK